MSNLANSGLAGQLNNLLCNGKVLLARMAMVFNVRLLV
jgi:hypothetical protein